MTDCKHLKSGGIANQSKQYQAFEKDNMRKMAAYFERSSPEMLQEETWFSIVYYSGFRRREVARELTPECFQFENDSENKKFVAIKVTYLSKNITESLYKSGKIGRVGRGGS